MSSYYYLVAGLPDIALDDGKLSCTVAGFKSDIYPHLSAHDQRLVDLFYLKFDNEDLLRLLKDKETVTEGKGNFTGEELLELVEAVRNGDRPDPKMPSYMVSFLTEYFAAEEEPYLTEDKLAAAYYHYAMGAKNPFIAAWFEFSLHVNNVLAALSARKYKMDISSAVVGDTPVCEQLRTSNARDFGLGDALDGFEALQRIAEVDELVEREKKVDLLKWKWMEDESFFHYFTIERLFVFLLRLEMIERWISLDKESGSELFRQLIQQLKDGVQIPEEFRK
ncbi:MAG: DUF2764 family protein [Bacteroidales bacterium]|nr:DUF2764 family protein [Bacteroidales bacterium]